MAKKKHSLIDFPEEVDKKTGVKIYGETSYENQIAVLSHYLHNSGGKLSKKRKEEIIEAIRDFLNRKNLLKINTEELTDETSRTVWCFAANRCTSAKMPGLA